MYLKLSQLLRCDQLLGLADQSASCDLHPAHQVSLCLSHMHVVMAEAGSKSGLHHLLCGKIDRRGSGLCHPDHRL